MPNLGSGNVIKNDSFFRGWITHTKKKRDPSTGPLFCLGADGESRTRTGLRPPPPQSGVSTISPHPLLNWDCKDMQFILHCNILFEFFFIPAFSRRPSPRFPSASRGCAGCPGSRRSRWHWRECRVSGHISSPFPTAACPDYRTVSQ